jgi:hypothetical protein
MSYHNALQDPNAIAWMIGARDRARERELEHRRALADLDAAGGRGLRGRAVRAIRGLDPRPAREPDPCPA